MISNKKMSNGFEYIEISNDVASAEIALQGANILHYTRKDLASPIWLSDISNFEYGKSIRGGVPICWPWFGMNKHNSNLPQHGFARTSMFALVETNYIDSKTTEVTLKLQDSKESFTIWPYHFELLLKVTVSDELTMELITTNKDTKAFEITQALHTYFDISHISNIKIEGLEDKPYLDALTWKTSTQKGSVTFNQEVDRVYQEVSDEISLIDKERTIKIKNEGSSSVVVWNPWIDKGARMTAMDANAYETFVCIESANAVDDSIVLKPNQTHTLKATIY